MKYCPYGKAKGRLICYFIWNKYPLHEDIIKTIIWSIWKSCQYIWIQIYYLQYKSDNDWYKLQFLWRNKDGRSNLYGEQIGTQRRRRVNILMVLFCLIITWNWINKLQNYLLKIQLKWAKQKLVTCPFQLTLPM